MSQSENVHILPKIRIARPTDNLEALISFYEKGLGFEILGRFDGHDGFDGIMFGKKGAPYHFEFTRAHGHQAGRAPTKDNLLVLYFPLKSDWDAAVNRMRKAGFASVPAFNPYWHKSGVTFEDADGYRIVFQQGDWTL